MFFQQTMDDLNSVAAEMKSGLTCATTAT